MTEDVIGKPTTFIMERLLLVPRGKEAPRGDVTEEGVTQEVADRNQTDREGPYTVKKGINDVVQGPPRLPGQVLLEQQFASSGWQSCVMF